MSGQYSPYLSVGPGSTDIAIPVVGVGFGFGPYYLWALVGTMPANPSRQSVILNNIGGGELAIIMDDGTAAFGSPPQNARIVTMKGSDPWLYPNFLGRIQVFAASSSAQFFLQQT